MGRPKLLVWKRGNFDTSSIQLSLRDTMDYGDANPALKGRATVRCRSAANRRQRRTQTTPIANGPGRTQHVNRNSGPRCQLPLLAERGLNGSRGFNAWKT